MENIVVCLLSHKTQLHELHSEKDVSCRTYGLAARIVVAKNLVYAFSFIRNGFLSEHYNTGTWEIWLTITRCALALCVCVCARARRVYSNVNGIYKFFGFYCWVAIANTTYKQMHNHFIQSTKNHPHVFGAPATTTAEKESNLTFYIL